MSVRPYDPETARRTCRFYRLKTDTYVNDVPPRLEYETCGEYPWCERTSREVGPDDGAVHRDDCAPGRGCFVPLLPPDA